MIMFLPLKHLSGRDLFLCEIEMNIKHVTDWPELARPISKLNCWFPLPLASSLHISMQPSSLIFITVFMITCLIVTILTLRIPYVIWIFAAFCSELAKTSTAFAAFSCVLRCFAAFHSVLRCFVAFWGVLLRSEVFSGATVDCDWAQHRNIILNRNCYHLASLNLVVKLKCT